MIKLELNLPERYRLVSIQRMPKGWAVCVCIIQPSEWLGRAYAIGESDDISEAARLAIANCERKLEAEVARPAPAPLAGLASKIKISL